MTDKWARWIKAEAELEMTIQTSRRLRSDLTPEERERAEAIGSVMDEFKSAGAKRKFQSW